MQKINIIQFLPYFPPHKGGVETVGEEFSRFYTKNNYGEVINVVFSVGQEDGVFKYEKNGYTVYLLPAFDLIANFPFSKFWKKEFWKILTSPLTPLLQGERYNRESIIIQTHTRFFLSSLIGCLK
ncbi:MAG: hypothetical protein PHE25_05130 [Candidatus Gracilibacteria bacterium]|nr:hypothetical protein [Candidatus Gracilibacteria bacterium]